MITNTVSDHELVLAYASGDALAFNTLLLRHQDKVFTHIYLLVKDQTLAEDIFQDTWIKVINTLKAGRYNDEGKFLPWITRIAHNLSIDYFRKSSRMSFVSVETNDEDEEYNVLEHLGATDQSIEDEWLLNQSKVELQQLVLMLPEEQREVLIMRHFSGMNFKDIATYTEVSINTALGRMRYALANLRKMIADRELELVY